MDGLGLGLLVLVLIGLAIRAVRSRATLGLLALASVVGAADLAEAQGVTIPNTFTNGEVADAAEVKTNFAHLEAWRDDWGPAIAPAWKHHLRRLDDDLDVAG